MFENIWHVAPYGVIALLATFFGSVLYIEF